MPNGSPSGGARFLDKELVALFDKTKDVHRETDAVILIEIELHGKPEFILIHREQQGKRKKDFRIRKTPKKV